MKMLLTACICMLSFLTFSQELNLDHSLPDNFKDYTRGEKFLYLLSLRTDFSDKLLESTDLYLSRSTNESTTLFPESIKTDELRDKKLKKKSLKLVKQQLKKLDPRSIHLLELDSENVNYDNLRITANKGWVYDGASLKVKYQKLSFFRNLSTIIPDNDIPIYGVIIKINAKSDERSFSKVIALHSSDFKLQAKNGVSTFQSGITISIKSKYAKEINKLKNEIKKSGLKIISIGYELISKQPKGSFFMPRNLFESQPRKLLLHSACNKFFNKWL